MKKLNIGRNDPCPCGSGQKYKHCCLLQDSLETQENKAQENHAQAATNEIKQALQGMNHSSMAELQSTVEQLAERRNKASMDDFRGLSPEQMHKILYFPFESPQVVNFIAPQEISVDAPIMKLFLSLAEGIGEQGLKPTAKGNLPQKFCRVIGSNFNENEIWSFSPLRGRINKEDDFVELHLTRLLCEQAALVRKYKGRFVLSRQCHKWLAQQNFAEIYLTLFKTYVQKYNWGYMDGYPPLDFIQQAFTFSLYLLLLYGDEPQSTTFYEDAFLQAFPTILNEVEPSTYSTPERTLRSCYSLRTLLRFACFFGLAHVKTAEDSKGYPQQYQMTKQPLLNAVVQFLNPNKHRLN